MAVNLAGHCWHQRQLKWDQWLLHHRVVDDLLKNGVHQTTIANVFIIAPKEVHQLLVTEGDQAR